jgi:hypothetical protein
MGNLRKLIHLPFPVHMAVVFMAAGVLAYLLYPYGPLFVLLIGFGLSVVLAFKSEIGNWFRSKAGGDN